MKPGRELDAMVAEKVMGLGEPKHQLMPCGLESLPVAIYTCANCDHETDSRKDVDGCEYYPPYSTDIAAAWEVVEKLGDKDFALERWPEIPVKFRRPDWKYRATFDRSVNFSDGTTAPHAICLAALKAVGAL
jgi:hypothetical protein